MPVGPADYVKAKAYQLWVQSIIGEQPQVALVDNEYLEITHTPEQAAKMRAWLDQQLGKLWRPSDEPPPNVQVKLGNVVLPWSAKYWAPLLAGTFILGYIAKGRIGGR